MNHHYTIAILFVLIAVLFTPAHGLEIPSVSAPTGLDLIDVSPFRNKTITDYGIPRLSMHYNGDGKLNSIYVSFANVTEPELLKSLDDQFGPVTVRNAVLVNANERVIKLGGETILAAVWKTGYDITDDRPLNGTISASGFPVFYDPVAPPGHVVYGHSLVFLSDRYLVRTGDALTSVYYKPTGE